MSGRLGRINVTLYYDELERASGGIWRMLADEKGLSEAEVAYWTGAAMALDGLRTTVIDGDWIAFLAALKMHFDGEPSGADEFQMEEKE